MEQARAKIAVLMKRASAWKLPDERAKTAIPVEEDVLPEEDPIFTKNIYDNVETVSYDQPWGADNQVCLYLFVVIMTYDWVEEFHCV